MWLSFKTDIHVIKKKSETLPKSGIIIINYDILGSRKNKKIVSNFNFSNFDRVIIDEFHLIKNLSSIRTKITAKIIKKTKNALLLSGTPAEKSAHLYVPLYSIGAINMTWLKYANQFCEPRILFLKNRQITLYDGNDNQEELKEIMKPYTLIMHKEDVIGLPDKIIKVIGLDLPVDKREKNYNLEEIEKDTRAISFEGLAELLHELLG